MMLDIKEFKKCPLLGIIRGVPAPKLDALLDTIINCGLRTVEITMNTPGASDLIRWAVKAAQGRLVIGAGTVLTLDELHQALDAGAGFIVSPTLIDEVVAFCTRKSIPVFPGALTPQEIYKAWQAGASMVKVFPAKVLGPEYIKEIKGPFADIELLACGGITPENVKTFFISGASAVAFGASIFKKEWIANDQFDRMAIKLNELVQAVKGGL